MVPWTIPSCSPSTACSSSRFHALTVWRVWDLVLATVLILVGINITGDTITPLHLLTFILLTVSGAIVIYSLWIVLIALTFWFTKFDNNVTILQALLDAGRYPVTVYPVWLRIIVTFIIPVAVATTVPLQALRGDLTPGRVLMFLGISFGVFWSHRKFGNEAGNSIAAQVAEKSWH